MASPGRRSRISIIIAPEGEYEDDGDVNHGALRVSRGSSLFSAGLISSAARESITGGCSVGTDAQFGQPRGESMSMLCEKVRDANPHCRNAAAVQRVIRAKHAHLLVTSR